MKKKVESGDPKLFSVSLKFADTFFTSVEYHPDKLVKLIAGYLEASKVNGGADLARFSGPEESSEDYIKWLGDIVVSQKDNGEDISLLSWYLNKGSNPQDEQQAQKSVDFISKVLPCILTSMLVAVIPASVHYAAGKHSQAYRTLLQQITGALQPYLRHQITQLNLMPVGPSPDQKSSEHPLDKLDNCLAFGGDDNFGGIFSFAYHHIPALIALAIELKTTFDIGLDQVLKANPSIDEDHKQEIQKIYQRAADTYCQIAQGRFINEIEGRIKSAILAHYFESVVATKLELSGTPFEENGIIVTNESNRQTMIRDLLRWEEKQARVAIKAHKQGGPRRKSSYFKTDEDIKKFACKVDELLPLWEFITDCFEKNSYDPESPKIVMIRSEFKELSQNCKQVPQDLMKNVFQRKSNGGPQLWPLAFALSHAARELGIIKQDGADYSFWTLKKRYDQRKSLS